MALAAVGSPGESGRPLSQRQKLNLILPELLSWLPFFTYRVSGYSFPVDPFSSPFNGHLWTVPQVPCYPLEGQITPCGQSCRLSYVHTLATGFISLGKTICSSKDNINLLLHTYPEKLLMLTQSMLSLAYHLTTYVYNFTSKSWCIFAYFDFPFCLTSTGSIYKTDETTSRIKPDIILSW